MNKILAKESLDYALKRRLINIFLFFLETLVADGKEPLTVLYPYDGLSVADSPLAYLDQDFAKKEERFLDLQTYLLSKVETELLQIKQQLRSSLMTARDTQQTAAQ